MLGMQRRKRGRKKAAAGVWQENYEQQAFHAGQNGRCSFAAVLSRAWDSTRRENLPRSKCSWIVIVRSVLQHLAFLCAFSLTMWVDWQSLLIRAQTRRARDGAKTKPS